MKLLPASRRPAQHGAALIIVLWIALGIVSIALFFGHSTSLELRAADHRVAGLQAEHAIEGAARYATYLLANPETPGQLPSLASYSREAAPLGDAAFWFIGRTNRDASPNDPVFALVDESSKINLNTATKDMLQALPRMTPELAAAILDWRDTDQEVSEGGAEDETYLRLNPPYRAKNARFESTDELRLVAGLDLEILLGEDTNRNGILDPNENDGDNSPPFDNRDGRLDPGILEYVTVFSRESNLQTNGSPRINLGPQGRQQLASLLSEKFGAQRANQILQRADAQGPQLRSPLEFFSRTQMTPEEFAQISDQVTTAAEQTIEGLINVNTAPEEVLACIPGIGAEFASSLIAYRQAHPDQLASVAWVAQVLDAANRAQAGPFITTKLSQVSADIAAVGQHGRGYRRARFVFDLSQSPPKIIHRQNLTDAGWALGFKTLNTLAQLSANSSATQP